MVACLTMVYMPEANANPIDSILRVLICQNGGIYMPEAYANPADSILRVLICGMTSTKR